MKRSLSKFLLIAPALLAIVVDYFGWGLVYPLATALMDDPSQGLLPAGTSLDMRDFYLSLSLLLYPLCMFIGSPMLGDLSDMYGRKKILFLSTLGIAISFLCMGSAILISSLPLFLVGRALSGLFAGTVPIAQATVVDLSEPDDKPFNLALVTLTFNISLVLGPLIGGLLSDRHLFYGLGYATPFLFSCLLALTACVWIRLKFVHQERLNFTKHFSLLRPVILFKEALRSLQIRQFGWVVFLFQFGVSLYIQTILIFFNEKFHYTSLGLGVFWVVMALGFLLGLIFIQKAAQKPLKIPLYIFCSLFTQGLAIALSSIFDAQSALWILGFIFSVANPPSYALLMTLFSDLASQESQGWAMGIWSSIVALAFVAGALSNNLVPHLGMKSVILIAGLLLFCAVFAFYRFSRKRQLKF